MQPDPGNTRIREAVLTENLPELLNLDEPCVEVDWRKSVEWKAFAEAKPDVAAALFKEAAQWIEASPYLLDQEAVHALPKYKDGYYGSVLEAYGLERSPPPIDGQAYDEIRRAIEEKPMLPDHLIGESLEDIMRYLMERYGDEIRHAQNASYPNSNRFTELLDESTPDAASQTQRQLMAIFAAPLQSAFAAYRKHFEAEMPLPKDIDPSSHKDALKSYPLGVQKQFKQLWRTIEEAPIPAMAEGAEEKLAALFLQQEQIDTEHAVEDLKQLKSRGHPLVQKYELLLEELGNERQRQSANALV